MTDPNRLPLMGRLAVHLDMITMDQLAEATREQARRDDGKRLGDILVELGMIETPQLAKLVRAQKEVIAKHRAKAGAVREQPRPDPPPAPSPSEEARAPSPPAKVEAPPVPAPPVPGRKPAPVERSASPAPSSADRQALDALLRDAVARGASDVHVHAGLPLKLRAAGNLVDAGGDAFDEERARSLALAGLDAEQRAAFEERGQVDFCYALEGVGRFRANAYRQQRGTDAVFRFLPPEPPTLDELTLPQNLARFTNYHQGLVLVTGPTGCGKSSTLAALVNLVNEERKGHILTIEDPIEYLHASRRCLVNQRSVGSHTGSFARALRAALREDPDVIVIGELRDLETISLALSAAETGHLVLATLHTSTSTRTLDRIIGAFPADQQNQVRVMLSESLRAVISQRLLPRSDGNGRVPALEILVVTRAIANLIRDNKTFQIQSLLQTGGAQGMALLDSSIRQHVDAGVVSREEALRHCEEPRSLGA